MSKRADKSNQKRNAEIGINVGQSFFDAPYGSCVCSCGAKVVAHGHCQECWDKFKKEILREHDDMVKQRAHDATRFDRFLASIRI